MGRDMSVETKGFSAEQTKAAVRGVSGVPGSLRDKRKGLRSATWLNHLDSSEKWLFYQRIRTVTDSENFLWVLVQRLKCFRILNTTCRTSIPCESLFRTDSPILPQWVILDVSSNSHQSPKPFTRTRPVVRHIHEGIRLEAYSVSGAVVVPVRLTGSTVWNLLIYQSVSVLQCDA